MIFKLCLKERDQNPKNFWQQKNISLEKETGLKESISQNLKELLWVLYLCGKFPVTLVRGSIETLPKLIDEPGDSVEVGN